MAMDLNYSSQLEKFEDQVAGHDRILKFPATNLLVIKPAVKKELEFYEHAQQQSEFECWIPKCFGNVHRSTESELELLGRQSADASLLLNDTVVPAPAEQQLSNSPRSADAEGRALDEHLCLENILYGFSRPCVLDVKLGTQLYDDSATPAKVEKMKKNAQGTTIESLGMRISGMKVYNTVDGVWTVYDKQFGRALTADLILDALLAFFFPSSIYAQRQDQHPGIRHVNHPDIMRTTKPQKRIGSNKINWILESLIEDISVIREYVQEHPELELISSSLLITFEGDKIAADSTWKQMLEEDRQETTPRIAGEEEEEEEDDDDEKEDPKLYDVRLIDFAHSKWTAKRSSQDEGLLMGFDNLLLLLQSCLDRQAAENL